MNGLVDETSAKTLLLMLGINVDKPAYVRIQGQPRGANLTRIQLCHRAQFGRLPGHRPRL